MNCETRAKSKGQLVKQLISKAIGIGGEKHVRGN